MPVEIHSFSHDLQLLMTNCFGVQGEKSKIRLMLIFKKIMTTVEPPIKDPLRKGQPLYKGHLSCPQKLYFKPPREDNFPTTTKWLVPKCPLFGGSTV